MHHFHYRNGVLHAEDVNLAHVAKAAGTPFYCYSTATIERHYRLFAEAVGAPARHVFYAMKANSNLGVLRTLANAGAGADTVSEGEIRKAIAAGIPASRIVFSGVGKTEDEVAFAVDAGLYQINIESEGELDVLSRVAAARNVRQKTVIRINPDIGAGGHAKITTGSEANKFGISLGEAERLYTVAANLPGVRIMGLAVHIGSQIRVLDDLRAAFGRMRELAERLAAQGHRVERIDLGGGLGIPYEMEEAVAHGPDLIEAYAGMIAETFAGLDVELAYEPGRLIVGNAGILVTRALTLNPRSAKTVLVVDAAMNDLIRPAMYEAFHDIWPVREPSAGTPKHLYDVVGPICESGDTFATGRTLPETRPGDLVALMTAGAYGAVMSSTYNSRLLVPEVMVHGGAWAVVRPRPSYEDLIKLDHLPAWLEVPRSTATKPPQ
jgi:diaminopimelate decarboxylase